MLLPAHPQTAGTRNGDRLLFTNNRDGIREYEGLWSTLWGALSLSEEQPDCPSLRALREHILIVRPQRARRMVWWLPSLPSATARCASTTLLRLF